MEGLAFAVIGLAFLSLLALNLFFRIRVLRIYRRLREDRVDFEPRHFFDNKALEEEVLPKYPENKDQIKKFIGLVKLSMTMATILLLLIIIFGYILFRTNS